MRNHFIQKAYLDNFLGNDGLFVYDYKNQKMLNPIHNTKLIGFQKGLYHFESIQIEDELIEKNIKNIEDIGISIVRKIIQTEKLPDEQDLQQLFVYYILQSLRNPSVENYTKMIGDKINAIDPRYNYRDLFIINMFSQEGYAQTLSILQDYDVFLIKMDIPLFVLTDRFCESLGCWVENVIPINGNLALYLTQKGYKNPYMNIDGNKTITTISIREYILLYPLIGGSVDRWLYGQSCSAVNKVIPFLQQKLIRGELN